MSTGEVDDQGIAIIGMSGRFPQSCNIDQFWQHLRDGEELISLLSDAELAAAGIDQATLADPNYVKAGGFLDDIELFDAAFFGFTPREAEITDPQHRLFLECAWESLEHAGYNPERYDGLIGLYAGANLNTYLLFNLASHRELLASLGLYQVMLANDKDYLATRTSYKLNLRGPSVTVQTACSTSLVAVHLACQALNNGECDMALAGGVGVNLPHRVGYMYREGSIMSPDGHCRAFSANARGTVDGNGVGVVVLKRLADALADGDTIHAVIKGSAINNDGAFKVGYTAPSVEGQAAVIAEALAVAGIEPHDVSYIEAHGTGTPLGDPIEIAALTEVYRTNGVPYAHCAIGSLKTITGHLGAAAGVAGLIKTTLALEHRLIPASLHFEQPNPKIDFANLPFYVNTQPKPWQTDQQPRRAGVSSFGIGGTNAHVVLEEAPAIEASAPSRPWQLMLLSARSADALDQATKHLATHLKEHPDLNLADAVYTSQVGRKAFAHRRIVVCRNTQEAISALDTHDAKHVHTAIASEGQNRLVTFMFPGQGTQYVHMAAELYAAEPVFRNEVDRCSELLRPHLHEVPCPEGTRLGTRDLRSILYPEGDQLDAAMQQLTQTAIAQPALFVIEYALAQLWMSWDLKPTAMIGHSIGEYVAACLAGVFSLNDALALVALRGRLMQRLPAGAMLSVRLSEEAVQSLLQTESPGTLSLAAVNSPTLSVVAGPSLAIEALQRRLDAQGVASQLLHTSHAFHSGMMTPIVDLFAEQVKKITLQPPTLPFVSNLSGTWITPDEATDPRYWAKHLRQTVRFGEGIELLLRDPRRILLEVGPGRALSMIARQQANTTRHIIFSSLRHPQDRQSDLEFTLTTLGKLWLAGLEIDWAAFAAHEQRQRVPLPTYPFERLRFWVDSVERTRWSDRLSTETPGADATSRSASGLWSLHAQRNVLNEYVAPSNQIERRIVAIWQELLGIDQVGVQDNFFELGGHSLMGTQMIARLREAFGVEIPISGLFEATTIEELALIAEELLLEHIEALPEDEAQDLVKVLFGDADESQA